MSCPPNHGASRYATHGSPAARCLGRTPGSGRVRHVMWRGWKLQRRARPRGGQAGQGARSRLRRAFRARGVVPALVIARALSPAAAAQRGGLGTSRRPMRIDPLIAPRAGGRAGGRGRNGDEIRGRGRRRRTLPPVQPHSRAGYIYIYIYTRRARTSAHLRSANKRSRARAPPSRSSYAWRSALHRRRRNKIDLLHSAPALIILISWFDREVSRLGAFPCHALTLKKVAPPTVHRPTYGAGRQALLIRAADFRRWASFSN